MTVRERVCWVAWRIFEGSLWVTLLACFGLLYVWYNEEAAERWLHRTVDTPQVEAGGYLVIHSRLYRSKVCRGWIERRMYDGIGVETSFDPDMQERQYLGSEERKVRVPVPITASPGPAIYRSRACWQCNPLQKVLPHCEDLQPLSFTILPPAHLPGMGLQQQPSVETRP